MWSSHPPSPPLLIQPPWCQGCFTVNLWGHVISSGFSWIGGFRGGRRLFSYSHSEALLCNQNAAPAPLLQISELNKRMSAVEHLLVHLENTVLPLSAQVTPRALQDQPTAFHDTNSFRGRASEVLQLVDAWCSKHR